MAMSKEGRRGFDINSVLKGCLPEENEENEKEVKYEDENKIKSKKEKSHGDVEKTMIYGWENNAPSNFRDSSETNKLKRRILEEDSSMTKKGRQELKHELVEDKEIQEYNGSAFRKVGSTTGANLETDDKGEPLIKSQWDRIIPPGNQNDPKYPLGLPANIAPPTYLAQQGMNLFNPFLGLNMLQQAEVSTMLANKAQIFSDQSLRDAFGRSVASMPTPLTESLANVKSREQRPTEAEPNPHLKNRFPFNQIINPMVEKLIHKNTSPILIHSPVNAANLSQNWCAKCNATFRMTSDLVYHMRSHHKREVDPVKRKQESYKLKCDVCHEVFKERHHLTRHMTSHL